MKKLDKLTDEQVAEAQAMAAEEPAAEEPEGTMIVETPEQVAEASAQMTEAEFRKHVEEERRIMGDLALKMFQRMAPGSTVTFQFMEPPPRLLVPNGPPPQPKMVGALTITCPASYVQMGVVIHEGKKEPDRKTGKHPGLPPGAVPPRR